MARFVPFMNPRNGSLRTGNGRAKMLRNLGSIASWLVFTAIAVAVFVAPAAEATPINYNFKVDVTSGPLAGTTDNGSFSYDSSSVIPGGNNNPVGLLTALNFTFNGISYNAGTANTGWLGFGPTGDLTNFIFGTNCAAYSCSVTWGTNQWWASPGSSGFGYSTSTSNQFSNGNVIYALAVPEPGALGMFGLGTLAIGLFVGLRRRMC